VIRLVKSIQDAGVPIHGVGNQSHYMMSRFPERSEGEQVILDFTALGVGVMITELDLNILPSARDENRNLIDGTDIYTEGLPEEQQQLLAQRYRELFEIYYKHRDLISRVTLWGHADADSWLNYLPMERVNHPLI